MTLIKQYMEQLREWDKNGDIGPTDISNAAAALDLSRFTIWTYLRVEGKNINTAEDIYNYFKSVVDARRERLEKDEILKDYTNE